VHVVLTIKNIDVGLHIIIYMKRTIYSTIYMYIWLK
jgi:hypothetical protein